MNTSMFIRFNTIKRVYDSEVVSKGDDSDDRSLLGL